MAGYRECAKTVLSARKIGGFCWRVLGCVYHFFLAGAMHVPFTSTPAGSAERRLLLLLEPFAIVHALGRHEHHDGVFSHRFAALQGTGAIVQPRQLVGGSGGGTPAADSEFLFADQTVRARPL